MSSLEGYAQKKRTAELILPGKKTTLDIAGANSLERFFHQYEVFEIDTRSFYRWASKAGADLAFSLKLEDGPEWKFSAQVKNIRAENFKLRYMRAPGAQKSEANLPLTIEGSIGKNGAPAVFTLKDDFLSAFIQYDGRHYYLERLAKFVPGSPEGLYVFYRGDDLVAQPGTCGVQGSQKRAGSIQPLAETLSADPPFPNLCLDFMAVADHAFYQLHGSNTTNEVTAVFNAFNTLYQNNNIGLNFVLSSIVIFDNGDPYEAPTDIFDLLQKFRSWSINTENNVPPP